MISLFERRFSRPVFTVLKCRKCCRMRKLSYCSCSSVSFLVSSLNKTTRHGKNVHKIYNQICTVIVKGEGFKVL